MRRRPRPRGRAAAEQVRTHRAATLTRAYRTHPDCFRRPPQPPKIPTATNPTWVLRPCVENLAAVNVLVGAPP